MQQRQSLDSASEDSRLFVLGLLVGEALAGSNVFSKLVSHHLLRYCNVNVGLSIVDSEAQADEVGEDGCCAFCGADWG